MSELFLTCTCGYQYPIDNNFSEHECPHCGYSNYYSFPDKQKNVKELFYIGTYLTTEK